MTGQAPVVTAIVNDTGPAQQPANPFSSGSLLPMLIGGLVLSLVGMIAAVMCS
jgi:hypothetical protein